MGTRSRKLAEARFDAAKNGQRLLEICKRLGSGLPVNQPNKPIAQAETEILAKF